MQLLKLKSRLHRFEYFADFAKEFELGDKDLVITNEFLYEPFMKSLGLKCHFVMQENYGLSRFGRCSVFARRRRGSRRWTD